MQVNSLKNISSNVSPVKVPLGIAVNSFLYRNLEKKQFQSYKHRLLFHKLQLSSKYLYVVCC